MKKILIVEDEPAYLELLRDELVKQGYIVATATDGKEGLAHLKLQQPDLVILDIRMPNIDGITMLSMMRQNPKTKHTKVMMLTNLEPDSKIIDKMVADQPLHYCVKSDVKFGEMIEKIDELMDYK